MGIIWGLLAGACSGLIFGGFVICIATENEEIIMTAATIVCSILGLILGGYIDIVNYEAYISSYNAKKEVIELSLKSETISDLEKIEIVKQVTELNGELAEAKVSYNKFIYFYLDRNKINNIEAISLDKE